MKYLFALLFFVGCTTTVEQKPEQPKPVLAWGDKYPEWDQWLLEAIEKSDIKSDVKNPCKTVDVKTCLAQALSKIAERESNWQTDRVFVECSSKRETYTIATWHEDRQKWCKGTKKVLPESQGLFQLSKTMPSVYKCENISRESLFDPKVNIECAVNVAVYWLNKDKVFFGSDELGLGQWWHSARKNSRFAPRLQEYMSKL